jgi:hypothetical protein
MLLHERLDLPFRTAVRTYLRGILLQHNSRTFSDEAAAEKHMAQLQHNMWVANARSAVLSIITGGGMWVELTVHADPLYQHLLLTAEKKFWRCIQDGVTPRLFGVETPRPRLEAVRIVDMAVSNSWAEFAATYRRTRPAYQEHEGAKAGLKKLVPEDAKEAVGHGLILRCLWLMKYYKNSSAPQTT